MVDVLSIGLALMLLCVGLGLGVTLSVTDFREAWKTKRAIVIGLCSQFVFMPLCAFTFAKVFDFSDELAIGLILTGSAPGGSTSNLFT
jgi:BASS family bile acid:Na+ symporter